MTGLTSTNDAAWPGARRMTAGGKQAPMLVTTAQRLIHAVRHCKVLLNGRRGQ